MRHWAEGSVLSAALADHFGCSTTTSQAYWRTMAGEAAQLQEQATKCPQNVLEAIYGKAGNKQLEYEKSLNRWWAEYSDRKNDEEEEHVADSLLYNRNHLPRSAPPPDSVFQERERQKQQQRQEDELFR